jgi:Zn-dependent alcohol dehydrogenase
LRYYNGLGCSREAAWYKCAIFIFIFHFRLAYSMTIKEGSTVAVFGAGAIGLGVISTAHKIGASRIIAIDINPGKEVWAKKFGASDFVNAANLKEGQKIQNVVVEMTDGGCDFTFDCTGNVNDEVLRSSPLLMPSFPRYM